MADIDELTISPKPPSSGMITNYEILDGIIGRLAAPGFKGNVSLKVVVFNDDDFAYARNIHKRYPHLPFFMQVGNEDTVTMERSELVSALLDKYEMLIEKVIADQELKEVKVLPQLHALVWGNKRGV
jgi:7-carboxy-7-deazaguanine synthase